VIEISFVLGILVRVITASLWVALAAIGLAVIFGMMGVINLAHGALITLGAYVAYIVTDAGSSLAVAFVAAPIVVAAIGYVLERSVIRLLYERPLDTLLATWGFSLIIEELIKLILGTSSRTVPNPFPGSWQIIGTTVPRYRVFISLVAVAVICITYILFMYTEFGIKSRAVIQNKEMANRLGANVQRMYTLTFIYGAALAGLAGAVMAPLVSVDPRTGLLYLVQSFFVVIIGGTGQVLVGTVGGSGVVGGFRAVISAFTTETLAFATVFLVAMIIIRVRPQGLITKN
jgi:urea ABC transporter permease protein UrtB